jgi:hypothetical protein
MQTGKRLCARLLDSQRLGPGFGLRVHAHATKCSDADHCADKQNQP